MAAKLKARFSIPHELYLAGRMTVKITQLLRGGSLSLQVSDKL